MAIEQGLDTISRVADVDLSAKQYNFAIASNGKAGLPGADGVRALGVIQNNPIAGKAATVATGGITHVVSDGTIEVDKPVAAKSGGKAKEAASGEYIQGTALEGDGGVDGTVIAMLLQPQGRLP
jgi:hypothetical protein